MGIPLSRSLADMGGHNSAPVTASSKMTMGLAHPRSPQLVFSSFVPVRLRLLVRSVTMAEVASTASSPFPPFATKISFVKIRASRSKMDPTRILSGGFVTQPAFFSGGFCKNATWFLISDTFFSTTLPSSRMTETPWSFLAFQESLPLPSDDGGAALFDFWVCSCLRFLTNPSF